MINVIVKTKWEKVNDKYKREIIKYGLKDSLVYSPNFIDVLSVSTEYLDQINTNNLEINLIDEFGNIKSATKDNEKVFLDYVINQWNYEG